MAGAIGLIGWLMMAKPGLAVATITHTAEEPAWPTPTACSAASPAPRSPPRIVHEDDLVVAFQDIAPRAPTHMLLMPREHIASAAGPDRADAALLGATLRGGGADRARRGASPTAAIRHGHQLGA